MTCRRCTREIESDSAYCRFCGKRASIESPRRLTRLVGEGKIAGVCAGIAAHFNVDVTLVRLAWVILAIVPGVLIGGLIAYVAAWVLMPASETGRFVYLGRRLIRSEDDKWIAGVCGGLGEYLGVDSTIVRIVAVILAIYPGAVIFGILAYVIVWAVIPPAPLIPLHPSPNRA